MLIYLSAFHQGSKQGFLNGEQEPWVFRGGLAADLQVFNIPKNLLFDHTRNTYLIRITSNQ